MNTYESEHFANLVAGLSVTDGTAVAPSPRSSTFIPGPSSDNGGKAAKSFIKPHKTPALMWSGPLQNKRVSEESIMWTNGCVGILCEKLLRMLRFVNISRYARDIYISAAVPPEVARRRMPCPG